MKLFFRRQLIYYKNHIDAIPMIITTLALIVFTLGIYCFTPVDIKLQYARFPWAQGEKDLKAPICMIQFFAVLASILNFLVINNFRKTKKVGFAILFYGLCALQIVNDIYYVYEINRLNKPNVTIPNGGTAGIASSLIRNANIYAILHLVLVILSVLLLAFAPLIQSYTKKIKLKPLSNQDKDLQ